MTLTEDSPELASGTEEFGPGIDPERLAVCLSVLDELDTIEIDHPDAIAVRRATAGIYRTVKQRRRQERRAAKTAHDKAVTEATATGSADRIDDETQGVLPSSSARAEIAGVLQRPRSCYICKTRYVEVDAFYHQLCPQCAKENRSRRDARTDLTGQARAPHRRPREDRHVHRAAAAARRCAHHHHHSLPQRRDPPLQGDAGQRRVDPPAEDRRHRSA